MLNKSFGAQACRIRYCPPIVVGNGGWEHPSGHLCHAIYNSCQCNPGQLIPGRNVIYLIHSYLIPPGRNYECVIVVISFCYAPIIMALTAGVEI